MDYEHYAARCVSLGSLDLLQFVLDLFLLRLRASAAAVARVDKNASCAQIRPLIAPVLRASTLASCLNSAHLHV